MSELAQAIEEMRNMRESYDELSRKMTTPLEWTDKDEAVETIDEIASEIYVIPTNE